MVHERSRRHPLPAFLVLALGTAVGLCGCHQGGRPTIASTTSSTAAATTSTMPTTTLYQPSAAQATRDAAAMHLVAAWKAGDRAAALTDATPAAVAAVFAQPYPAGGLQFRNCASAVAGPSTCTYRIYANGNLVELSASQAAGGWIISATQIVS